MTTAKLQYLVRPKFFILVSLLGLLLTTGCATIYSPQQAIRVTANVPGAEVYVEGAKVAETPAIISIERERESEIIVKFREETKTLRLKADHYRWSDSFWPNCLFFGFATVGWITDLASGAAWEYKPDHEVSFPGAVAPAKTYAPKVKGEVVKVAVAPPRAENSNISDETGRWLVEELQKELGEGYKVLRYDDTIKVFDDISADFDEELALPQQLEVAVQLNIRKILSVNTDMSGGLLKVKGTLIDLYNSKDNKPIAFEVSPLKLKSVAEMGWSGVDSKIFYWLPNSFAIEASDSNTSLNVKNDKEYKAESEPTNDFWGQASQYLSAISIRHIDPPTSRHGWRYSWKFIPTSSLSYAQEEFPDFAAISDQEFKRLHIEVGYGINMNYGSSVHNFYFNIVPVVSYDKITSEYIGGSSKASDSSLSIAAEFGYHYFFTSHWYMRAFSRSTTVPEEVWEEILRKNTGQHIDLDSSSILVSGISIGYLFPNSIYQFAGR